MSVELYEEVHVQTDEEIDQSRRGLDLEARSLTSAQAGGVSRTAHAQPGLDMSPIKQMNCAEIPDKGVSEP